mgnify:CR=1 FL=1
MVTQTQKQIIRLLVKNPVKIVNDFLNKASLKNGEYKKFQDVNVDKVVEINASEMNFTIKDTISINEHMSVTPLEGKNGEKYFLVIVENLINVVYLIRDDSEKVLEIPKQVLNDVKRALDIALRLYDAKVEAINEGAILSYIAWLNRHTRKYFDFDLSLREREIRVHLDDDKVFLSVDAVNSLIEEEIERTFNSI